MDFPKVGQPFADPMAFIGGLLKPIGDEYRRLLNWTPFNDKYGVEAAKQLAHLQRLDNNNWIPPALRFFQARAGVASAVVNVFIHRLKTLAYFLFISRADINARISRYSAVIKDHEDLGLLRRERRSHRVGCRVR